MASESLGSFRDNFRAERLRRATTDLCFFLEHLARALLARLGIESSSHQAVHRMLSYHYIRPGHLPVEVARHLNNLYDRRVVAEYSPSAGWEFTSDECRHGISTA